MGPEPGFSRQVPERLEARASSWQEPHCLPWPAPPLRMEEKVVPALGSSTDTSHSHAAASGTLSSVLAGTGGTAPGTAPACLPAGRPVAHPHGCHLTNGVSFLQHYDPGLVVVMVNLAVVIFYFQTEFLFCHQCTNMLGFLSLL